MTNPCFSQQPLCLSFYLSVLLCLSHFSHSAFSEIFPPLGCVGSSTEGITPSTLEWVLPTSTTTSERNMKALDFVIRRKRYYRSHSALGSSFSFKSPILLTCFVHVSSCMPSNILTVLFQTLPTFTITDLRWERPEMYNIMAGEGRLLIYTFWPLLWVVPHALLALITTFFTHSFPEYMVVFILFG